MTIAVGLARKATKQTKINFGCSKELFIETVLLSTHNICFRLDIR